MVRHRLFFLLVALVTGLILAWSQRLQLEWDWSSDQHNRLSQESLAALRALQDPVEVQVFLEDYPVQRAALRELLEKYRRASRDFHYRFIDPTRRPELVRELAIVHTPTLVLRAGTREQRVEQPDEAHLTTALARLGRRGSGWIGALTGHGEARLHGRANFDLGDFGQLLTRQGYQVVDLDLAATGQLPGNLDLLVLAAPASGLSKRELALLQRYLDGGGSLLWLADGRIPQPLAGALGLRLLPGTLVDAAAADLGIDQPTVVVARPATAHPVTRGLKEPVLMPKARALGRQESPWKWRVLLQSSPRSWNETGALKGVIRRDSQAGEERGPLPVAVALEREAQRAAVAGDADFLSNAFLGNGANRAFGLALVRWLTGNDRLIQVRPRQAADRRLHWPASTLAGIAAFFLAGLPLLLAGTGIVLGWWRRRR